MSIPVHLWSLIVSHFVSLYFVDCFGVEDLVWLAGTVRISAFGKTSWHRRWLRMPKNLKVKLPMIFWFHNFLQNLPFYNSHSKSWRKQFLNPWLLMTLTHSPIRGFELLTGECVHKCRTPTVWDLNRSQCIGGKLIFWCFVVCFNLSLEILTENSTPISVSTWA